MEIAEILKLARKFTPEQINSCITQQIETGENICLRDESTEKIVSELSKARFILELIAQGIDVPDAIRELARRIRRVQKGFELPKTGQQRARKVNCHVTHLPALSHQVS